MGAPMAARLAAAGFAVTGFDARPDLRLAGVEAADSPAAVTACSELVLLSLPGPREVEEVVLGPHGVFAGGHPKLAAVADTSTSSPRLARRLAEMGSAAGIRVLDCPVSGGPPRASDGTLAMMVGGDAGAFAQARPILERLASFVVHAGPSGAGQVLKLCNNLMTACNMVGVSESLALATGAGLDPQLLFDVITRSTGDSSVLRRRFPIEGVVADAPVNSGFSAAFPVELMQKDVRLALDLAAEQGLSVPLTRTILDAYDRAADRGWGELDYSVVARLPVRGSNAASDEASGSLV